MTENIKIENEFQLTKCVVDGLLHRRETVMSETDGNHTQIQGCNWGANQIYVTTEEGLSFKIVVSAVNND